MDKRKLALLSETEALERLLCRLPFEDENRKFLEVEHYRRVAGVLGEERLRRKLKELDLDEPHHLLFDVNLRMQDWKVQIDGLLLAESCAIVIESKNIQGEIHFERETDEFYRFTEDRKKTVLEDPTIQLAKHIRFLEKWFADKNIQLPVDGVVVFTSKQCQFISKPLHHHICKTYQLIHFLHKILQQYPQMPISHKLSEIIRTFSSNQSSFNRIPLCSYYRIDPRNFMSGMWCRTCERYTGQSRNKAGWKCSKCSQFDYAASELAIREYFSLVSDTLSNRELRAFCNISSPSVASRLLAEFDLEAEGPLRNRAYRIKK